VDITNLGYVEGGECLKLFVPEEHAVEATKLKGQEEQEGEEGEASLVGHPVLTPGLEGQAQEGCSCIRGGRRGGGFLEFATLLFPQLPSSVSLFPEPEVNQRGTWRSRWITFPLPVLGQYKYCTVLLFLKLLLIIIFIFFN
jgi:hypothetical protein